MTDAAVTAKTRWVLILGLVAATVGPLTGLVGTVVALLLALVLLAWGQRRSAGAVVLVALLVAAFVYALRS